MIAFYNEAVGPVLMVVTADNEGAKLDFERRDKVSRVFRRDTGAAVAYNFFDETADRNGQIDLSSAKIGALNAQLTAAGFVEQLTADRSPKFVVAEIVTMAEHPDSDHLHICQVNIGLPELTQIVCGAPNAREGLKTVAALPGAMMPSGALIFDGVLRGVASHGMLCSPRELSLPDAPDVRGIIELTDALSAGVAFDAETMWTRSSK